MIDHNLDLLKLSEECSELIQIATRYIMFNATKDRPWQLSEQDIIENLQDEIADVLTLVKAVVKGRGLDAVAISERMDRKRRVLEGWGVIQPDQRAEGP